MSKGLEATTPAMTSREEFEKWWKAAHLRTDIPEFKATAYAGWQASREAIKAGGAAGWFRRYPNPDSSLYPEGIWEEVDPAMNGDKLDSDCVPLYRID